MDGSHPDAANYHFMYELSVCVYMCERAQDRDTLCSAAEGDVGSGFQLNYFFLHLNSHICV